MPCRLCGMEMHPEAFLCRECGHYQFWLWRWLPFIGKSGVVVSLIVSAWVYYANLRERTLATETGRIEIGLVSFNSQGEFVFRNSGDRDVFVQHVVLELDNQPHRATHAINSVVPHCELLVSDVPGKHDASEYYRFLPRSFFDERKDLEQFKRNLWYAWYSQDHPELQSFLSLCGTLMQEAGTATIVYSAIGAEDESKSLKIPSVALQLEVSVNRKFAEPPTQSTPHRTSYRTLQYVAPEVRELFPQPDPVELPTPDPVGLP